MFAKSLMASVAVMFGLLAIDIAVPSFTDATAEARGMGGGGRSMGGGMRGGGRSMGGGMSRGGASRGSMAMSRSGGSRMGHSNVSRSNVSRSNHSASRINRVNTGTSHVNRVHTNTSRVSNSTHVNRVHTNSHINRVHTNTHVNTGNRGSHVNIANTGTMRTGPGTLRTGPHQGSHVNNGSMKNGPGSLKHNPNHGPHINVANPGFKNGPRVNIGQGINRNPPGFRPGNLRIAGRVWPFRGADRIWWFGRWRNWVPFTSLAAVTIGGDYFWPEGYVAASRPYCSGVADDGCQLNWQFVEFEDGGGDNQCVRYCPRPGEAAPAQTMALASVPAAPPSTGRCELTIFSEARFTGADAPTAEDQPRLAEVGWKDEISSIRIDSGTWDFFTDDEFQGQNMRLPPGQYPALGTDWTKSIGSFLCVQGG